MNQLENTLSTTLTGNMASDLSSVLEDVGLDTLAGMAEAPLTAAASTAAGALALFGITIGRKREDEEEDGELGIGNGDSDTTTSSDSSDLSSNFTGSEELDSTASSPTEEDYFPPATEEVNGLEGEEEISYGIKPVVTGGEVSGDKTDRGDNDSLSESNFALNSELLQQYYFATTKEKAAEMLAILCKKDPVNATAYYKTLADAMKKWESTPPKDRINENGLEKKAEKWIEEKIQSTKGGAGFTYPKNDQNEPDPQMLLEKIAVPAQFSLLDRNMAMIQNIFYSTNKKDTQLFIERLKASDSNIENQKKYDELLKNLVASFVENKKIPNLNNTFKNAGLEFTNIQNYETKDLKFNQFDEQRKSALFDNFIRRLKLEDTVFQKEELAKEMEKEGDVVSIELKATKFTLSELDDKQKLNGSISLTDKVKIEEFQKSTIDSLNSLSDSYFFKIKNGSIVVQQLKGVKETKPLGAELIQKNFIERETIDGGTHTLEFTYGEKNGKPNGGWTYENKEKDIKSATIQMHPQTTVYQPVTSHANIKDNVVQDKDQISYEYTDHNITLAHEMIHSLKDLNGTHIDIRRQDDPLHPDRLPGSIVRYTQEITKLIQKRNEIIKGSKLDNIDIQNAKESLIKNGESQSDEDIKNEIIIKLNQVIILKLTQFETLLSENFYIHEGYNSQTRQMEDIPVYKEEAITTWGINNLKDISGNPPSKKDIDKHASNLSDNSLREELGSPSRLNYINNTNNIFYLQNSIKLMDLYNNRDSISGKNLVNLSKEFMDTRYSQFDKNLNLNLW